MNLVDRGTGAPIVIIPGVQGRWEWMRPAVEALAERNRVITFSLADEPTSEARFDETRGFWSYVDQVRDALVDARLERAAICGVSYGGLIATAFASHHPEMVASLVLVSALPPSWRPDRRLQFYVSHPWLTTPAFCLGAFRLYREIAAANDTTFHGALAAARHGSNVLRHMFHPIRMANRVALFERARIGAELGRVKANVLVITGEDRLERVVPPRFTREYLGIWPHARSVTLSRTGHLGLITRPGEFASIVSSFVAESENGAVQ